MKKLCLFHSLFEKIICCFQLNFFHYSICIVGGQDKLAPPYEVEHLANTIQLSVTGKTTVNYICITQSGHMVFLEKPKEWREHVLKFLNH